MDTVESILKTYVGIGVAVLALQVAGAKYLEHPHCAGGFSHVMVDRAFPYVDDATLLKNAAQGIHEDPLLPRLLLQVVRWAPDFYVYVIAGDMKVGDYIRGGAECHPPIDLPVTASDPGMWHPYSEILHPRPGEQRP